MLTKRFMKIVWLKVEGLIWTEIKYKDDSIIYKIPLTINQYNNLKTLPVIEYYKRIEDE